MRRARHASRRPAPLGWAFALAFVLLAAQWLGLAHTVLHPQLPAHAAAAHAPAHGLGALFAGHADGSGDCRLYDQLAHAEPLPPALPALDTLPPAPPRIAAGSTHDAAAEPAPYAARGPPRA
ncbi:hypothetical protein [Rubrivivax gelatinosus]|uniref:DUF2946 family protein n=1 Tax=Rubrivivax gelatinosus (strain NBRC 100245 / IL144) TaxID=983917 RepID=I0HNB8_RUBGI|nr:hypothetical protein [Rubrivivax gelatinosus]MBG6081110.1 hypothetical protein [Rubrivivax gelatinosus]BAL94505.1 hypothetical protein RGE_11640 [Rubrivivax gelatinosus IL144]